MPEFYCIDGEKFLGSGRSHRTTVNLGMAFSYRRGFSPMVLHSESGDVKSQKYQFFVNVALKVSFYLILNLYQSE